MPCIVINKFVVADAVLEDFLRELRSHRKFLATQPGFLCGTVYRKTSGPDRFNVVNMAFWENAGALATALTEQQVGCKRHTPR